MNHCCQLVVAYPPFPSSIILSNDYSPVLANGYQPLVVLLSGSDWFSILRRTRISSTVPGRCRTAGWQWRCWRHGYHMIPQWMGLYEAMLVEFSRMNLLMSWESPQLSKSKNERVVNFIMSILVAAGLFKLISWQINNKSPLTFVSCKKSREEIKGDWFFGSHVSLWKYFLWLLFYNMEVIY